MWMMSLNCRINCLTELTLIRSRDDALLISEVPLTDVVLPELRGYGAIHHDKNPRTRVYVKNYSIKIILRHETTSEGTTIYPVV